MLSEPFTIDAADEAPEPWLDPAILADGGADNPLRLRRDLRRAEAEIARLQAALVEQARLADHDALTGLLNRRGFERALAQLLAACRRYRSDAALIYLDLDGFKALNDRAGHAAGDAALKTVAETLLAGVRESDLVARLGGDEFAVVLLNADKAAAEAKGEALDAAITRAISGLGASFGVRVYESGMAAAQMLAEADAAMYVRKGDRKRA
jgi:diguanylate cyclase (GGDEF)-like protein